MAKLLTPRVFALPALLLSGLSLSACSLQGNSYESRYAGANCDLVQAQNCAGYGAEYGAYGGQSYESYGSQSIAKSRYGTAYSVTSYEQYAYAPQPMMLRPAPTPAPFVYQQPSYEAPAYNVELYNPITTTSAAPADCPAGTTAQADGTCLQGSSLSYSSAAITTSSSYSGGYMTSETTANCPAGTTAQSDGTCLQGASSSLSFSSSNYTSPSYSSTDITPPISTHDFSEYNWGSKDTTWGGNGYVSPGTRTVDNPNSYPAATTPSYNYGSSYMPVRK